MKLWLKILLIFGGVFILLAFFLIVPVIIMDQSWWWFFIPLIFLAFVGIIIGIIILITRMRKKPPLKLKIDLKDAEVRAIHEMKNDENNPDNFKIKERELRRVGEKGAERTPVLILKGIGTELSENRIVIINLNNPKQEMTKLVDPSEDKIERAIRTIAEYPEEEIREETTIGLDRFGRPITTTKIRRPSTIERKAEEEKKEAEEVSAI